MTVYVLAFVTALFVTYVLTPIIKRLAVRVGAMDVPDARKVHHGSIPRLGGLAIFIGLYCSCSCYCVDLSSVMGLIAGSIILIAVGVWMMLSKLVLKLNY